MGTGGVWLPPPAKTISPRILAPTFRTDRRLCKRTSQAHQSTKQSGVWYRREPTEIRKKNGDGNISGNGLGRKKEVQRI